MKILPDVLTRKYYVILCNSGSENKHARYSCYIKKANKLELLSSYGELGIEDILSKIPKYSNIIFCLGGKAVLSRYAENKNDDLFPEIDQEDFYIQKSNTSSKVVVESICRKAYVDLLISQFKTARYFTVDIALSPTIATFLDDIVDESIFTIEYLDFKLENSKIYSIEEAQDSRQNSEQIKFYDQNYKIDEALGFASLIKFFKEGHLPIETFKFANEQSKFFHKTRIFGFASLAIVFFLLFANFIIFGTTDNKLRELKSTNQGELLVFRQIETLQAQISEYSSLINSSDMSLELPYYLLLDRIAYLRPSGLWLNTLEIHPVNSKPGLKNNIVVDTHLIKLTGEVKSPVVLNKYIKSLREEEWVKDIVMRNFSTHAEKNNAAFILEILI
jgi:hypothetical protein